MVRSQDGSPHLRRTKVAESPQSRKITTNLYQARLAAAVAFLRQLPLDVKINYDKTANQFKINASTLRNRYLGIHDTPEASYNQQRILTAAKEEVMMEWMFHHADEGRPWSSESIRYKVEKMTYGIDPIPVVATVLILDLSSLPAISC